MDKRVVDIVGNRYGRLTVLCFSKTFNHHAYWLCKCDCGNETVVEGRDLRKGNTKSCGCLKRTKNKNGLKKGCPGYRKSHGMKGTRIYRTWCGMKTRCLNPNHPRYKDYGGRGITICKKWLSFDGFYDDMKEGYSDELTLDRIDNNKGYYKDNCKWSTTFEQMNNRRNNVLITINGETDTVSHMCLKHNARYEKVIKAIEKGRDPWSSLQKYKIS